MKIAIIGSGISGLTAGYFLHKEHDIQIFEASDWIGGHTHTVKADDLEIDTGFIVFNDKTYPNFKGILDKLGVTYKPTTMSFSVRNDKYNLEYNGNNLNSLFSDRKNLFRPKFYMLLRDILRFNKLAKAYVSKSDMNLGEFLDLHKFGEWFRYGYILPMGSAIWSMGILSMLEFPVDFLIKFFANHGLLDIVNRPQWLVIEGGSDKYIPKLTSGFCDKIHCKTAVEKVCRKDKAVEIKLADGSFLSFDHVVFACHSDQALRLIDNPTLQEKSILGAIKYSDNDVILHKDTNLLPRHKLSHASWNYLIGENSNTESTVTYNMNILQGISSASTYCVTLNGRDLVRPESILAEFSYSHPVYSEEAVIAQKRWAEISGLNNTHYCGAYWANGFHEDGVVSAINVCNLLGVNCAV